MENIRTYIVLIACGGLASAALVYLGVGVVPAILAGLFFVAAYLALLVIGVYRMCGIIRTESRKSRKSRKSR